MSQDLIKKITYFESLEGVSSAVLKSIAEVFDVNTVYLAKREDGYMDVRDVYNLRHEMVEKGMKVVYKESYCQFVMGESNATFESINLMTDEKTVHVELAKKLGFRTFLGATLFDREGSPFGTLCLIDDEEKILPEEQIALFKHIANLLSYLISLDEANHKIEMLSTPIVPLMQGIAVLPLIGIFDEQRGDRLTKDILSYCAQHEVDYFLIDLSGMTSISTPLFYSFIGLIEALQLMGVDPIVTGIRPELALTKGIMHNPTLNTIKTNSSVELALKEIM